MQILYTFYRRRTLYINLPGAFQELSLWPDRRFFFFMNFGISSTRFYLHSQEHIKINTVCALTKSDAKESSLSVCTYVHAVYSIYIVYLYMIAIHIYLHSATISR